MHLDTISYISEKKRKITCDWVAWKEIGMAKDYGTNQDTTFKALKTSEGLNIIDKALSGNTPRIFGGKINYEQDLIQLLTGFHVKLSDEIEHKIKKSLQRIQQESTEKVLSLKKEIDSIEVTVYNCKDCNDKVTLLIARCWSHCLGFTEFNADADFTLIGGDSIAALSIVSELSIYLGKEINLASFISNSTINKLCDFIKKNII